MTLPIKPCLRGPRRPPAAGVLLLALAFHGCDAPLPGLAAAGGDDALSPAELIEAHIRERARVTLGGPVAGSGEARRAGNERTAARASEKL
jgi:hypothetical protein